ncbi:hypothetical protein ACFOOP_17600 [Marinicaulis aureus]|uniref:Uncharacterized protein n=1 Tax=Hyphococcus aureus TaxID=2666033 RepID=A0ABW1L090_9PROT
MGLKDFGNLLAVTLFAGAATSVREVFENAEPVTDFDPLKGLSDDAVRFRNHLTSTRTMLVPLDDSTYNSLQNDFDSINVLGDLNQNLCTELFTQTNSDLASQSFIAPWIHDYSTIDFEHDAYNRPKRIAFVPQSKYKNIQKLIDDD